MARRAAKVDNNQSEIVRALQDVGATVQHLHAVGMGCPDILIGFRNCNWLAEIKDGSLPPSARQLTPAQVVWHERWQGQVAVIESVDQALNLIGLVHIRGVVS